MTDPTHATHATHATDTAAGSVTTLHERCCLTLVRRLVALLDRDPAALREGDALPRGWHPLLFNAPTPQAQLRSDGAAQLGVSWPDIGLPRLMLGGRETRFSGDIPVGALLRRESRCGPVQFKQGRSGRFALVTVEHQIFIDGASAPALTERLGYILRPASTEPATAPATAPASAPAPAPLVPDVAPTPVIAQRRIVPDERLLFRYSAITDNPHRIHYDTAYALAAEGYPALVVNGSIAGLFLLEMLRTAAGREPAVLVSRNVAPMFCGQPLDLCVGRDAQGWRLWAHNALGQTTFDARAEF